MIHESAPWKDQLLADADLIERWAAKPTDSTRRSILIEKKVFLSAYAMRKLFEAEKLSSNFDNRNIAAERYELRSGQKLTWRTTHRFDEVFDLEKSTAKSVSAWSLMDTIIHSKIFVECVRDETDLSLIGFFVTSDKRENNIWLVPIEAFIDFMRRVGRDYPSSARWYSNPETGVRVSWRGDNEPSAQEVDRMLRAVGRDPKS